MEKIAVLLVPVLLGYILLRLMLRPLGLGIKILIHSCAGLTCLTAFNAFAAAWDIMIPINAATALVAASLGLPGITLLAALEML